MFLLNDKKYKKFRIFKNQLNIEEDSVNNSEKERAPQFIENFKDASPVENNGNSISIEKNKEVEVENNTLEELEKKENKEEIIEQLDEIEPIIEAEEVKEIDEIEYLTSLISDEEVKYPGKIDIFNIDPSLLDKIIEKREEFQEEKFGINKVQIFYNIDKQIYRSRTTSRYTRKKLEEAKKGYFLPILISSISIIVLIIALFIFNIYQKIESNVSLEDNIFKDESIMTKLAQKLSEEKLVATKRLEEERKKLEEERKNRESLIQDELKKRELEIEHKFQKKIEEIKMQKNLTEEEMKKMIAQYENAKQKELEEAKIIAKQQEETLKILLRQKELEIEESKMRLQKEKENIMAEIERIKMESERRRIEEESLLKEANKRLEETRKNEEEVTSFNIAVSQLINSGLFSLKQNKYDEALELLNNVKKFYESKIDFVKKNENLSKRMETDILFIQNIKNLVELSKVSLNKEYENLIKKYNAIGERFIRAEKFYADKKIDRAEKEYQAILTEIEEINNSYQKLKDIEKLKQNQRAFELYNMAIKENNKEKALATFISIIKNTPLSDYAEKAIEEIIDLTSSDSFSSIKQVHNKTAEKLFNEGKRLVSLNKYEDALQSYYKIIEEAAFSDYTKEALAEIRRINNIIYGVKEKETKLSEENLRLIFEKQLDRYKEAIKNGEIEKARIYYLEALNTVFNKYLNNTLNEFLSIDNKYIAQLKEKQVSVKDDKMVERLQNQIKEKDRIIEEYQKRIDELLKSQTNVSSVESNFKEKIALLQKYEDLIKEKDFTIQKLREYISEVERSGNLNERNKLLKEYEEKLNVEKEKLENLKKQLYESYKKNSELVMKVQEVNELRKKYEELKQQYAELEKKFNEKIIASTKVDEKSLNSQIISKIEKELNKKFEEKLNTELEKEKIKLKQLYENQLKDFIMQRRIAENFNEVIEDENRLFGQITEINGNLILFQFLSLKNDKLMIKEGDIVEVVRILFTNNEKKEITTGFAKIVKIKENSIYGKAEKISDNKGYKVEKGDILKK